MNIMSREPSMSLHLFAEIERGAAKLREHFVDHVYQETIMKYLDDLIGKSQQLKTERAELLADRDAQKARADKAEADRDALQSQISDDEAKAQAALADVSAEVSAEAPSSTAVDTNVDTAAGVTIATAPDGSVTTLDHGTGSTTTVDSTGATVATDPAVAAQAVQAAQAAGVTVAGQ